MPFLRRHALVLGGGAMLVLFVLALWKLPQWQVVDPSLSAEKRIELENKARATLAQFLGGMVVLVGLYLTWWRIEVAREGQVTERFTRAIEQLGSDSLQIRLGGIYALERIARDSARDHWPIMEVLTAYVRERARWEETPEEAQGSSKPATLNDAIEADQRNRTIGGQEHKPRADIQAILTVLGRRIRAHETSEDQRLDLRGVDIRGANLIDMHFERALLIGAHLEEADMTSAHLEGANLREAHLERARLPGAHLEKVNLAGAWLMDADFAGTYFDAETNIYNSRKDGVDFSTTVGLTLAQFSPQAIQMLRGRLPDHIEDELRRRSGEIC